MRRLSGVQSICASRAQAARHADGIAAVARAGRPDFAARDEHDLAAIRRQREVLEAVVQRHVLEHRRRRHAPLA